MPEHFVIVTDLRVSSALADICCTGWDWTLQVQVRWLSGGRSCMYEDTSRTGGSKKPVTTSFRESVVEFVEFVFRTGL